MSSRILAESFLMALWSAAFIRLDFGLELNAGTAFLGAVDCLSGSAVTMFVEAQARKVNPRLRLVFCHPGKFILTPKPMLSFGYQLRCNHSDGGCKRQRFLPYASGGFKT